MAKANGMVSLLHDGRFYEVPATAVQAAGLRPNQHGVVNVVYDEVSRRGTGSSAAVDFPAACPACGAEKVADASGDGVPSWDKAVTYACGGRYTHKPQIQNHTDKWWGLCPATQVLVAALVTEYGK